MKLSHLFFIICFLSINDLFCQKQNSIWHFGLGASLDFTTGIPLPVEGSQMLSREGCASVSDWNGNLLFYTNGLDIWKKNGEIMMNGSGLAGGAETSSTHQVLIVPQPNDPHLYFVFTTDERAGSKGLNYSIVDISKNSGQGEVILKNSTIYTPTTERMALARHSNQRDFWLITHDWNNNDFRTFLIDENGINLVPVVSSTGQSHEPNAVSNLNARGCMQVNLGSNQLALSMFTDNLVETFYFDNCMGTVVLQHSFNDFVSPYGVAFSPNSEFLYVSNLDGELFQIQLLDNTFEKVGQTTGDGMGAIRYADDGKLYIAVASSGELSVIDAPNEMGQQCNFRDRVISLGNANSGEGLPQRIPVEPSTLGNAQGLYSIITSSDCMDENIEFSINSDQYFSEVIWHIDGSYPRTEQTTDFTFRDTGTYVVSVILKDECRIDTLADTLHIQQCDPPIFIPNGFSPNQDGVNDTFEPKGNLEFIEQYEMFIFSRWGERIFYTKDIDTGWDGTFRNQQMGEGVYVWMMKIKYFGMKEERIWSGDLTLLR